MNIGLGITGSFCTHNRALVTAKKLVEAGHNVFPIVTDVVVKTDTRFGKANDFLQKLKEITKNEVVHTITQAEPLGPKGIIDVIVIAPCTGNTLSKLANAITDNAVTMTAKSLMRNNKPVVVAVATNDGLGLNFENIAKLTNTKNVYLVPLHQDDPTNKPKSLIADWEKVESTINFAMEGKQIQPLFF